jgi:hypothetical protein
MTSNAPAAKINISSTSEDGLASILAPFLSRSTGPTEMQDIVGQITDIIFLSVIKLDPSLLEAAIFVPTCVQRYLCTSWHRTASKMRVALSSVARKPKEAKVYVLNGWASARLPRCLRTIRRTQNLDILSCWTL